MSSLSLRTRIVLTLVVLSVAATIAVGVSTYRSTSRVLRSEVDRSLEDAVDRARARGPGRPRPGFAERFAEPRGAGDVVVQLLGPSGRVFSTDGVELPVEDSDRELAGSLSPDTEVRDDEIDGTPVRILTAGRGGGRGAVMAARSLVETERVLDQLGRRTLLAVLVVGGLAAAAGALFANQATRRLSRLTQAAEAVAATGDLSVGVPESGHDETGRLAGSFNAMLAALARSREEQRRLVQDAGHELRTPLTSLTLALHLLAFKPELTRDMAHVLQVSADRLQALVERVLRLGQQVRGESRTALALASIELLPLLEDIAAEYAPVAHAKGLQLLIGVPEGLAVWGERSRLRRALHEVLDNAVRYSSRGAIQVTAEVQDGLALISITDQGPGIPDEEREHLFDSFYRGRSARALAETPGAGLGLNLAKRDIELLGGQIWLERSGSDGSMMCVSLPAVQLSYNELGAPD